MEQKLMFVIENNITMKIMFVEWDDHNKIFFEKI